MDLLKLADGGLGAPALGECEGKDVLKQNRKALGSSWDFYSTALTVRAEPVEACFLANL